MKKIIIFLMAILGTNIITTLNVKADTKYSFYEGNYIDNIWMTKEKNGIKYYQKARYFMMSNANSRFAYCIEPFAMFNENSTYTRSITASNLSEQQMKRISLIAYFGYGYEPHGNEKWYAITQYMIWKEADPSGDMYFTDSLNGNRINAYTSEINEINNLINNYLKLPSIADKEINIVEGKSITLTDTNNVLSNYTSSNSNVKISGNKLIIDNLKEGSYSITLTRDSRRTTQIPFFYNSADSQNMTTVGDVDDITVSLKINVKKTSLEITKIDKDTQDIIPSGDGSLDGAVYQLYDSNMNELKQLTINNEMKANIENLDFGKYFLKEIKPGTGYKLDKNIYEFVIDNKNLNINLKLENEIIKKKVEIHKEYGDKSQTNNEPGISFDIIRHDGNIFKTITTDSNGYACVYLPYGKYTIKQKNSTSGYASNEDFEINVETEDSIKYNLYDYKIKVPNTSRNTNVSFILLFIFGGLYAKKRVFC